MAATGSVSITSLETLIQEGKVRYFLTSGSAGMGGGMNAGTAGSSVGEFPLHGSGPVHR